jgi:Flp pilus assembly pilin Flp
MSIKSRARQLGQGMTEYIIIVALIAISAIVVYNLFGSTVREQVGDMAAELGGGTAEQNAATTGTQAQERSKDAHNLSSYQQTERGAQ